MKKLGIVGAALGIAILGGFSALGVQSLFKAGQTAAPTPPPAAVVATAVQVAPAPALAPPVPTPTVIEPPAPIITPPVPPAPQLAQIINVKPHYESVKKPVHECYQTKQVYYVKPQPNAPGAGAVLGGIAGGLAGTAVHGKNHTAAVIAGAALGAVGGNAVQHNMNQPVPRYVYSKQCDTHYVSTRVKKGYEVTYLYNGQQGTLLMENKPLGDTMPAPY